MPKRNFVYRVFVLLIVLTFCFVAQTEAAGKSIKAGFCPGPYAGLFRAAVLPGLQAKGWQVEFVEFPDFSQPNKALASGEIDLNFFQHSVFLEHFKKQNNVELSVVAAMPTIGMGIYSESITSLDKIPNGARIAVPDDPTNLARALRMLKAAGLVKMSASADPAVYAIKDITDNPRNLKIVTMNATKTADALKEMELAVVNGNFAIFAGLDISRALYKEVLTPDMLNVIAIRTASKGTDLERDLLEVLRSEAYQKVIFDPRRIYKSFQHPAKQP